MLSKKSLVISLSLLTLITTQADAGSKQYYQYYVKARPANLAEGVPVVNHTGKWLGDHAYIVIKKRKRNDIIKKIKLSEIMAVMLQTVEFIEMLLHIELLKSKKIDIAEI